MKIDLIKQLEKDITKTQKALLTKAKKGLTDNFGSKEMRELRDKYFLWTITDPIVREEVRIRLQNFDNWVMNFDLSYLGD